MKKGLQITMLIAVAAAGWFAWGWVFPSDEQKIKRMLADLAEDVSFTGEEGNFSNFGSIESLMSHLHPDVEILAEDPYNNRMISIEGRETLRGYAVALRTGHAGVSGSFQVRIYDPIITVSPAGDIANVDLTARISLGGEEEDFHIQELRFSLVNSEGDWLVRRVETQRTFGR